MSNDAKEEMAKFMAKVCAAEPASKEAWDATVDFMVMMQGTKMITTNDEAVAEINYCTVHALNTLLLLIHNGTEVKDPMSIIEGIMRISILATMQHTPDYAVNNDTSVN